MHTKFERLLSLTTMEVMTYYLVVHTGPDVKLFTLRVGGPGMATNFSHCLLDLVHKVFAGRVADKNNNNRIQRRKSKFFTFSSLHRKLSPTLKWPRCNRVQITCNTLSAYHMQHVVLHATWYEGTAQILSLTAQLLILTEFKSHFSLF